ncbi:MAG: antibiotic resistance protein [Alphaproteobacteria bacterium]|nr:antibiotic resistance protein [Alphaproteobacteria bacterium]MDB5740297.1 antibiotic resistance protein [Alphaproteobacteria bacterium]
MNPFLNTLLLTYAALFPIINPVGSAPIFLSLTNASERGALAWRVARNSFILLLASVVVGSHVLEFFGISVPVLRIGGGLVVTSFGWKLLNSGIADGHDEAARAGATDSFYPLTMPLTVGPGSISVAITLGSQRPKEVAAEYLALLGSAVVAGLVAIAATIYLCYRFSEPLVRRLGVSGTNVVVRLSAFILLCIGIQIIWSGWSELSALPH